MTFGFFQQKNSWILLIFVTFCLLFFFFTVNPKQFYFLNDDFIHIPLAANFGLKNSSLYRPLSDLSLWLDYRLWGKEAAGYHITNILIHLCNSVMSFFLAKKLFIHFNEKYLIEAKSFFVSILFLLYAFHSETIFWILGRGASICTFFFIASLIFYLDGRNTSFVLSILFFIIGLFAYETIWVFPITCSLLYMFQRKDQQWVRLATVWGVFLFYLVYRFLYMRAVPDEYEFGTVYNLEVLNLFYKFNTLIARSFLPPLENSIIFLGLYILLVVSLIYLVITLKNKCLIFLISCLIFSVLPTVTLGIDTHDSESERYIYLTTIFTIITIIHLISKIPSPLFIIAFLFILILHSGILYSTSNHYKTASRITKNSLKCLSPLVTDSIAVMNLPSQYKGALIFRTGFPEAVSWILDKKMQVNILSKKEINYPVETLSCRKATISSFSKENNIPFVNTLQNEVILNWQETTLWVLHQ